MLNVTYGECLNRYHYAECRLNVNMLSVVILTVVAPLERFSVAKHSSFLAYSNITKKMKCFAYDSRNQPYKTFLFVSDSGVKIS
jgi:hypothetical protein